MTKKGLTLNQGRPNIEGTWPEDTLSTMQYANPTLTGVQQCFVPSLVHNKYRVTQYVFFFHSLYHFQLKSMSIVCSLSQEVVAQCVESGSVTCPGI